MDKTKKKWCSYGNYKFINSIGFTVPTLYKQYSELCDAGGVEFADFNVDPDFSFCVDGLIVVDLHKLKEKNKKRYITQK